MGTYLQARRMQNLSSIEAFWILLFLGRRDYSESIRGAEIIMKIMIFRPLRLSNHPLESPERCANAQSGFFVFRFLGFVFILDLFVLPLVLSFFLLSFSLVLFLVSFLLSWFLLTFLLIIFFFAFSSLSVFGLSPLSFLICLSSASFWRGDQVDGLPRCPTYYVL